MNSHWYAAVLAGGVGTRLWPKSRRATPKQFLRLVGERTMLRATMDRLDGLVPWDRRYVVTGRQYVDTVAQQLPELPREQILAEPVGKNTAPSIGWVALRIAARDPNAVMTSLASDHVVRDVAEFRRVLRAAYAHAAAANSLMTLGIHPTRPDTGFGYIHVAERVADYDGTAVHRVAGFREKPERAVAEQYVASGDYLWNASMFAWRVGAIVEALRAFEPDLSDLLDRMEAARGTPDEARRQDECFAALPNIAIDYAVMERAENVCTIRGDFGWDDIGSWAALGTYETADEDGNQVRDAHVISVGSTGNLVHGTGRLVALVGVEGLVVVDTPDALLVCRKEDAVAVRHVVERLKQAERDDLT